MEDENLFKKYFKLPFKGLEYDDYSQVFDSEDNLVFEFEDDLKFSNLLKIALINLINNEKAFVGNFKLSEVSHKNSYIYYGDISIISIRGWGHLTGTSGLNLSQKLAKEIQDSLAQYIIKQFNPNKS